MRAFAGLSSYLYRPGRIRRVLVWALPFFGIMTLVLLGLSAHAFFTVPPDYLQGDLVRIMLIHVPAAQMSLLGYGLMTGAALSAFAFRNQTARIIAREMAPVVALFAFVCLATGAIWGRPAWGVWWVFDARLTSVLVLFFTCIAIMALERLGDPRPFLLLTLAGAINLPIVKFSVDWWQTLHQPASLLRIGRNGLESSTLADVYLWPLLLSSLLHLFLLLFLAGKRVEAGILETIASKAPPSRGLAAAVRGETARVR